MSNGNPERVSKPSRDGRRQAKPGVFHAMSPRGVGAALAAYLVALGTLSARAETIDATSTTIMSGRQDPRDGVVHTVVPAFELVSLRATDLRLHGVDDMAVVISGWGELTFGDPADGRHVIGDVDLAFVEGRVWRRRVAVRLGRQFIVEGAARNFQLDGLSATVRPWRWVGLTAAGGVPVTPRFAVDRGDAMVTGCLFVKPTFDTEAGVSILHVIDNGEISRQDLALDARIALLAPLVATGFARWSLYEGGRLAEGDVALGWQFWDRRAEIAGDYRRLAPDLFLPRNSIFAVFSQETRDEAGGYASARFLARLRANAEYHVIVDESGTGHDAAAKVTSALGADRQHSLGVESRLLVIPSGGYEMGRAFGIWRVRWNMSAIGDASAFFYRADVNGQRESFVGAATLVYDFDARWRALVTGIASVTPFATQSYEGMAKLVYQATTRIRERRP